MDSSEVKVVDESKENPPLEEPKSEEIIAMPDDQQLVQSIRKIIDAGDLETLTFNQVFASLSQEFKVNLTEKKAFLKQQLLEIISQKNDDNNQEETPQPSTHN
jgi:hypothetical protein